MLKAAIFNLFVLVVTMLCLRGVTVFQIDSILSFSTRYLNNSMEVDIPFLVWKSIYRFISIERKTTATRKHMTGRGEMCLKLYTELGGKCDVIVSHLQCPDVRN